MELENVRAQNKTYIIFELFWLSIKSSKGKTRALDQLIYRLKAFHRRYLLNFYNWRNVMKLNDKQNNRLCLVYFNQAKTQQHPNTSHQRQLRKLLHRMWLAQSANVDWPERLLVSLENSWNFLILNEYFYLRFY